MILLLESTTRETPLTSYNCNESYNTSSKVITPHSHWGNVENGAHILQVGVYTSGASSFRYEFMNLCTASILPIGYGVRNSNSYIIYKE